jgi:hypothetical protein
VAVDVDEPVAIRAAYERFPASVKGAFLLRGADGLPHQVRIESARAAEISGRTSQPIPIEPLVLEVAPTQDTFVPFEVPTMDMAAGWYRLECEVLVDGLPMLARPGDRFAIAWPRSSVRRGSVTIGKKAGGVALETLECAADSVRLAFAADTLPTITLRADAAAHPIVEVEFDQDGGRGRVIGYPVLRTNERLTIEVRGERPVEVKLP